MKISRTFAAASKDPMRNHGKADVVFADTAHIKNRLRQRNRVIKQNTPIIAERQIRLINASLSICNADFFKSLPIANSTEQTVNRNTLQVNMTATQKISPSTPYIAIINGCPIKITLL